VSNPLKIALAGAGVAVAVIAGLGLLSAQNVGTPDRGPTPDPTASAPTAPRSGLSDVFEPGPYAMSTAREGPTATLLADGRVLLVGGFQQRHEGWVILDSAETYEHSTGELAPAGSMARPRQEHTATLLPDGRVLIAGGWAGGEAGIASAEIYDPESGTFSPGGLMGSPRRDHAAVALADGRVLITGGRDKPRQVRQTAEIYDPVSGEFAPGSMAVARLGHTSTLLADGRVLIAGGRTEASAEIYDPVLGTFAATGSMARPRGDHTATLLADGRVLMVGGCGEGFNPHICVDFPETVLVATAEIYDPASGAFAPVGSMAVGRQGHTATLLQDGRVLVAGGARQHWAGRSTPQLLRHSAEVWDPDGEAFIAAGPLTAVRIGHTATLLQDGRVLIAGGREQRPLDSVELYQP
jgi:hypothetical protein